MKGFKSFADTTVLEFEPGVTAVVGPNGSGKSNVVDAVTWVLGAQSTRALRSAKMDDVIFMGTATRPALGRAEVALTLDNSSGRLAIDGAEVTISRTLFRNGDSEYAINGTTCRLLDVQDLLSDSGVGRQQHMIIGQGQLDAILNSSPESRRAVIEEAAGVLKHRRRKERSERRLAQTQENLERLGDLVREVRRQMRPLERQAQSARAFADLEEQLRAARHVAFARRLAHFATRRAQLDTALEDARTRDRDLRRELVALDARASAAAADMASHREEVLASTLGTLQGLGERARGTASVIDERRRALRAALVAAADETVIATLEADAARLESDLVALSNDEGQIRAQRVALADARGELARAQQNHEATWGSGTFEADTALLDALRTRAALLERSLVASAQSARRSAQRLDDARASATGARERLEVLEGSRATGREQLDEARRARDSAERAAADAELRRREADAALREASEVATRTTARAEALARALDDLSGAGGRAIIGELDGVLGAFVDLIEVESGWERAVESAAGGAAGGVVVDGRAAARAALEALRRGGGAGLVLAAVDGAVAAPGAPEGTTPVRSLVRARRGAPAHVDRVLDALFARAFVAPDWESGIDVAVAHRDLVIVTPEGDRFAASGWRVTSGRAVVTRASVEEAAAAAAAAGAPLAARRDALDAAEESVRAAREELARSIARVARAESALERVEADVARTDAELATLADLGGALEHEVDELTASREALARELDEVRADATRLAGVVEESSEERLRRDESLANLARRRDEVGARAEALAREEARVAEHRRLLETRRSEIEARLAGHVGERARVAARRESLEYDLAVLDRLAGVVEEAARDVRTTQETMSDVYREQLEASRAGAQHLEQTRVARAKVEARVAEVGEEQRRAEVELAELAVTLANVHEAIRRDLGVEPEAMGPAPAIDDLATTSIEELVGQLEARVTSLGPINPLALEELRELEERYRDLDAQVADVRAARRELLEVVRTLDDEIMASFTAAFADVNDHFSTLIAMLFPGGQGRLQLSEPDDPLTTGVEIEVRPMGRNVRRLSLLSGGERSMAALAFLFAVFRSRPSPFYLMDEVEAALDDVNLQRFLSLVNEFRDEAQLLVVTHQKRTMEAADALYGVTMVPGASSKVVSQRVRRNEEALS